MAHAIDTDIRPGHDTIPLLLNVACAVSAAAVVLTVLAIQRIVDPQIADMARAASLSLWIAWLVQRTAKDLRARVADLDARVEQARRDGYAEGYVAGVERREPPTGWLRAVE